MTKDLKGKIIIIKYLSLDLKLNTYSPTNSNGEKQGTSNNTKGESSLSFDFPFKKDGLINSKFYPPKTKVCRDDSNQNMHFSNLNVSTFSTYLENNPMLRYFDSSTNLNIGGDTINMDTNLLTKPTAFIFRRSDKDLFIKQQVQENSNSPLTKEMDFPVLPICENVNNAFINMNVNMNVTNNPQLNNSEANNSYIYPGNLFTNCNNLMNQSNIATNNTFNSNFNQNISVDINTNKFIEAPSELSYYDYYPNNFSAINKYPPSSSPKNIYNNCSNFPHFRSNEFNNNINRDPNNKYIANNSMSHFNYSYNYSHPNELNYFNNSISHGVNFQNQNPKNYSGPNLSINRGCNFPKVSQPFGNIENNYINIQNSSHVNPSNHNMYYSPNFINSLNNNNVSSNIRPTNSREINRQSKNKQTMSNYLTMDISELAKHVYVLAKDQAGCRFIQKKLNDEGETILALIFPGIMEHLVELMNDAFGNYLIQKLFGFLSEEQLFQVLGIVFIKIINLF